MEAGAGVAGDNVKSIARGRKGADRQAMVPELEHLDSASQRLIKLRAAAKDAANDYSDAVNKIAEKAKVQASVVRKWIDAKAGDKYDDKKREVEQLHLVFSHEG